MLPDNDPITLPLTATADVTPGAVAIPEPDDSVERAVLVIKECPSPVELVSNDANAEGLTIPTVTASDQDFLAGTYRLTGLQLYLRASAPVVVKYLWVYPPLPIT